MVELSQESTMGLNIKNLEVEQLAAELATLTGESKTETIRKALQERKQRLQFSGLGSRAERLKRVLEERIWPALPDGTRGTSLSKAEREEILGYGPDGV